MTAAKSFAVRATTAAANPNLSAIATDLADIDAMRIEDDVAAIEQGSHVGVTESLDQCA